MAKSQRQRRREIDSARPKRSRLLYAVIFAAILGVAFGFGLSHFAIVVPLGNELNNVNSQLANYVKSLKPNFNVFDFQKTGNSIEISVQNIGNSSANNVTVAVSGAWIPPYMMNVTDVEQGFISTGQIATVFNGTISNYPTDADPGFGDYARRLGVPVNASETDGETYLKLTVQEDGVLRYLRDDEISYLEQAFGERSPVYIYDEAEISTLNIAETKTLNIDLLEPAESYQIEVSCSEGIVKTFTLPLS